MGKPFLTIGIASYNYANYLPKAFEQIKKQQFKDYEILYCDDGSTDDSVAVIENLIRSNPQMQIRLIRGENEGLLANRNRIIENARGKYLLICDADDYMAEDCLEKLCDAAQEQNADCVIGGFAEVNEEGKEYKVHIPGEKANKWIYIWHHAQIYSMEIVRKHMLRFESIPDDVCFIQRIHQYSEKTVFVSEKLYYWLRHSDSTSRDIGRNSDWHPVSLWKHIVECMAEIYNVIGDAEKVSIQYFLYKWFYFNITDLPVHDKAELRTDIKVMQEEMRKVCSKYRRFDYLIQVLMQNDTLFAKVAILLCWILEGIRCVKWLPHIRSGQWKIRG